MSRYTLGRMADVHEQLRSFWDQDALVYDRSASHAASDPVEAATWRAALRRHLPAPGSSILDVGAGTGAMSLLAAEIGFRVTALDLSPAMLARAREKADRRNMALQTVVAPATEPPEGPFDAVIERHLLWTTPDPVSALSAWRRVAPGGRLVLFEGIFNRQDPLWRIQQQSVRALRAVLGIRHDHHGGYDPDLLDSLPLAASATPAPLIEAVVEAGWAAIRIERLRDVEWARRMAAPPVLRWLEGAPQYALVADDSGQGG